MKELAGANGTTNPFTLILETAQNTMYRVIHVPAGFRTRSIVLLVINGCLIVLSLAYLVMMRIERLSAGSPSTQWLFQFVRRPSGKLLVPNSRIVSSILAIICASTWIWLIVATMTEYISHGSRALGIGIRAFVACPVFLHGWTSSWALFATYILTTANHSKHPLSSVSSAAVNLFFVGVGVSLLLGCIGLATWHLIEGVEFWHRYATLVSQLRTFEAAYPNVPADAFATVDALSSANAAASAQYYKVAAWTFGFFIIPAFSIILLNLAGLGIARRLGQQIRQSKQLLAEIIKDELRSELARPEGVRPDSLWIQLSKNQATSESSEGITLNVSVLRSIASSNSVHGERARTVAVLSKARSDLIMVSLFVGINACAITAVLIFAVIACVNVALRSKSWAVQEISYYGAALTYSVGVVIATIALMANIWRYRTGSPRTTTTYFVRDPTRPSEAAGATTHLSEASPMRPTSNILSWSDSCPHELGFIPNQSPNRHASNLPPAKRPLQVRVEIDEAVEEDRDAHPFKFMSDLAMASSR